MRVQVQFMIKAGSSSSYVKGGSSSGFKEVPIPRKGEQLSFCNNTGTRAEIFQVVEVRHMWGKDLSDGRSEDFIAVLVFLEPFRAARQSGHPITTSPVKPARGISKEPSVDLQELLRASTR